MDYSVVSISDLDGGGRNYVGVSNIKDSDKTRIVVPYGFTIPSIVSGTDDAELRKLRRYVKVIQKALHASSLKKEGIDKSRGMNSPLAAVSIIHDYLLMGYFIEYGKSELKSDRGNINFRQTVKQLQPKLVDDDYFFYDSFITNKKAVVDDGIVALAQGNIINHFISHGGDVLFGQALKVPVRKIRLDKHTLQLLREEQNNTFNSRKQNLIRWSIAYINGLLNPNYEEHGEWSYAIIASSLWETIVDSVFGNQSERDKTQYGKTYSSFSLITNNVILTGEPTQHDTIYEDGEYIFIIDSKMYASHHSKSLLSEEILGKQFGYYVEAKKQKPNKKIVNVLFLPNTGTNNGFQYSYILDPHTPTVDDPDKIIFVYTYSVNDLVDDYYYGKKQKGKIKDDFVHFIQEPIVRKFLDARKTSY